MLLRSHAGYQALLCMLIDFLMLCHVLCLSMSVHSMCAHMSLFVYTKGWTMFGRIRLQLKQRRPARRMNGRGSTRRI